jgi:hypothetical protein
MWVYLFLVLFVHTQLSLAAPVVVQVSPSALPGTFFFFYRLMIKK